MWLVVASIHIHFPNEQDPIHFYSNQTRNDIKILFQKAFKNATQSIFLSIYGISDPEILRVLHEKTEEGLLVKVKYDSSASVNLKKSLSPRAQLTTVKGPGLMHQKIAVIDKTQVFLGTANLTTTSLRHHANLLVGLFHPTLASYLENPTQPYLCFDIQKQQGEIYLFPDPDALGLVRLISQIDLAKKKIVIAMFTLTHPTIAASLIEAKKRGVDVLVAVDYYTAKGSSKKTLSTLENAGVKVFLSQGRELLHHKWAVIDEITLVMGSANWTKAAFTKNHDFLLFLFPLTDPQILFFKKLWGIIQEEAA